MSEPHDRVWPRSRWSTLWPLAVLAVVAALASAVALFFITLSWAFGGRGTPGEDFWGPTIVLLLGIAPAVVMLVRARQRRPERSMTGTVFAAAIILLVGTLFAPTLADTGASYADRLRRASLPLHPSETAFTVAELTVIAEAERDATLDFLDVETPYEFTNTLACRLSTGIPGTTPYVTATLHVSDWPGATVGSLPAALEAHWDDLGYDASLTELEGQRVSVEFVSSGEPALTGRAMWEPSSSRFKLRIDGPCVRG
jgi:hypothetical protein